MDPANDETVLGDFEDASLTHFGVTSRFYRRDGKFLVLTEGASGAVEEFEIKYTFGVDPLQQYLVEFPGGRLQSPAPLLGLSASVRGRPALVSPLRPGTHCSPRPPLLDPGLPELEHHLRRVPFDRPAQELRQLDRHL